MPSTNRKMGGSASLGGNPSRRVSSIASPASPQPDKKSHTTLYQDSAPGASSSWELSPSLPVAKRAKRTESASVTPGPGASRQDELGSRTDGSGRRTSARLASKNRVHYKEPYPDEEQESEQDVYQPTTSRLLWRSSSQSAPNPSSVGTPRSSDNETLHCTLYISSDDDNSDDDDSDDSQFGDPYVVCTPTSGVPTPDTSPDSSPSAFQEDLLTTVPFNYGTTPGASFTPPRAGSTCPEIRVTHTTISAEQTVICVPASDTSSVSSHPLIEESLALPDFSDGAQDSDIGHSDTTAAILRTESNLLSRFVASPVVNGCIADKIRKKLSLSDMKEGKAKNYIYPVTGTERLFKIGQAHDPEERKEAIGKKCGIIFGDIANPYQPPIKRSLRVERLIQTELKDRKYQLMCSSSGCTNKEHKEYFKVSVDEAMNATQRWTVFSEREPWDQQGFLLPFWEERLQGFLKTEGQVDWDEFVNAGFLDHALYNLPRVSDRMWEQRWPILCLIQTLSLLCVTFPSQGVLVVSIIYILSAFAEILFHELQIARSRYTPVVKAWREKMWKARKS